MGYIEHYLFRRPACRRRILHHNFNCGRTLVAIVVYGAECSCVDAIFRVYVLGHEIVHLSAVVAEVPPIVSKLTIGVVRPCDERELCRSRSSLRVHSASCYHRRLIRQHVDMNRHLHGGVHQVIVVHNDPPIEHAGRFNLRVEDDGDLDAFSGFDSALPRVDPYPLERLKLDGKFIVNVACLVVQNSASVSSIAIFDSDSGLSSIIRRAEHHSEILKHYLPIRIEHGLECVRTRPHPPRHLVPFDYESIVGRIVVVVDPIAVCRHEVHPPYSHQVIGFQCIGDRSVQLFPAFRAECQVTIGRYRYLRFWNAIERKLPWQLDLDVFVVFECRKKRTYIRDLHPIEGGSCGIVAILPHVPETIGASLAFWEQIPSLRQASGPRELLRAASHATYFESQWHISRVRYDESFSKLAMSAHYLGEGHGRDPDDWLGPNHHVDHCAPGQSVIIRNSENCIVFPCRLVCMSDRHAVQNGGASISEVPRCLGNLPIIVHNDCGEIHSQWSRPSPRTSFRRLDHRWDLGHSVQHSADSYIRPFSIVAVNYEIGLPISRGKRGCSEGEIDVLRTAGHHNTLELVLRTCLHPYGHEEDLQPFVYICLLVGHLKPIGSIGVLNAY